MPLQRLALVCALAATLSAPAFSAGPLTWLAGKPGAEGNLDGPVATATWGGPLRLRSDGDGTLVIEHYANTVRRIDSRGQVTTLAGKAGARGNTDGAAPGARLSWPEDAVRGTDGRIYVADGGNKAIRIIAKDGSLSTMAVRIASGDAKDASGDSAPKLPTPKALSFDKQGRLWIVSEYEGVLRVSADGVATPWAASGQGGEIVDLAADRTGQLWGITRDTVGRVHDDRFEPVASLTVPEWEPPIGYRVSPPRQGPVASTYGKVPFIGRAPLPPAPERPAEAAPPEFQSLDIDANGTILISEATRVLRLAPGAKTLQVVHNAHERPSHRGWEGLHDITHSSAGVLVAGKRAGLYRLDAAGTLKPYAGAWSPWDDPVAATAPAGDTLRIDDTVLLQRDGSLLALDRLNDEITQVDAKGVVSTWAGKAGDQGARNGPRADSRFRFPADMVQDRAGTIYVADGGSGRIRRISADGQVTTFAGGSSSRERPDGPPGVARFWKPQRLALDEARGVLYVLDISPYVGVDSTVLRRVSLSTGEVSTIQSVDGDNPRIDNASFDKLGGWAGFDYQDIAVGAEGTLYALDASPMGTVVWRIDPASGMHTLLFAPGPNAAEEAHYKAVAQAREEGDRDRHDNHLVQCDWAWCMPAHIAADPSGRVYVSDTGNHTVVRVEPDGRAGIIAGRPGVRGNLAGALPGGLNRPSGLGWTADRRLMIITSSSGVMVLDAPQKAPFLQPIDAAKAP